MDESVSGGVETWADRGVTHVRLNAASTRNALSRAIIADLIGIFQNLSHASARAVVLSARGPVFCSGLDLRETSTAGERPNQPFVELVEIIQNAPLPVVARVDGHARAAGVVLIGACDVAIAAQGTTYSMTETSLGLVPAVTLAVLAPKLDPAPLTRFALSAEVFDASAAQSMGLISEVLPVDTVGAAVDQLLDRFRRCAPGALAQTKKLLGHRLGALATDELVTAAKTSEAGFSSSEGREGTDAFREKREPRWVVR